MQAVLKSISPARATVQDVVDIPAATRAPVVIMQDVHLSPEAHRNIISVFDRLLNQGAITRIAVEGAFSGFSFASLRVFSDQASVRTMADIFVEKGRLAAHSYLGLTRDVAPTVVGIDDAFHYERNVAAYRSALKIRNESRATIKQQLADWRKTSETDVTAGLRQVLNRREAYARNQISLASYVAALAKQIPITSSALRQFMDAAALERELDFNRVERERRSVLADLAKKLSKVETSALLAQSQAYRDGDLGFASFYQALRELCRTHGVELGKTPALDAYIRYVLLADGIDGSRLFADVALLEQDAVKTLSRTSADRRFADQQELLLLSERLVSFELTPSEWLRYTELQRDSNGGDAKNRLTVFEEFYREADIRSEKMAQNLIKEAGNQPTALLTGGFHAPAISARLTAQGVPHIVVSPRLTKTDDRGADSYLSVFSQEKTPLDRLFSGTKLFLSPSGTYTLGSGHPHSVADERRLRVAIAAESFAASRRPPDTAAHIDISASSDPSVLSVTDRSAGISVAVKIDEQNTPWKGERYGRIVILEEGGPSAMAYTTELAVRLTKWVRSNLMGRTERDSEAIEFTIRYVAPTLETLIFLGLFAAWVVPSQWLFPASDYFFSLGFYPGNLFGGLVASLLFTALHSAGVYALDETGELSLHRFTSSKNQVQTLARIFGRSLLMHGPLFIPLIFPTTWATTLPLSLAWAIGYHTWSNLSSVRVPLRPFDKLSEDEQQWAERFVTAYRTYIFSIAEGRDDPDAAQDLLKSARRLDPALEPALIKTLDRLSAREAFDETSAPTLFRDLKNRLLNFGIYLDLAMNLSEDDLTLLAMVYKITRVRRFRYPGRTVASVHVSRMDGNQFSPEKFGHSMGDNLAVVLSDVVQSFAIGTALPMLAGYFPPWLKRTLPSSLLDEMQRVVREDLRNLLPEEMNGLTELAGLYRQRYELIDELGLLPEILASLDTYSLSLNAPTIVRLHELSLLKNRPDMVQKLLALDRRILLNKDRFTALIQTLSDRLSDSVEHHELAHELYREADDGETMAYANEALMAEARGIEIVYLIRLAFSSHRDVHRDAAMKLLQQMARPFPGSSMAWKENLPLILADQKKAFGALRDFAITKKLLVLSRQFLGRGIETARMFLPLASRVRAVHLSIPPAELSAGRRDPDDTDLLFSNVALAVQFKKAMLLDVNPDIKGLHFRNALAPNEVTTERLYAAEGVRMAGSPILDVIPSSFVMVKSGLLLSREHFICFAGDIHATLNGEPWIGHLHLVPITNRSFTPGEVIQRQLTDIFSFVQKEGFDNVQLSVSLNLEMPGFPKDKTGVEQAIAEWARAAHLPINLRKVELHGSGIHVNTLTTKERVIVQRASDNGGLNSYSVAWNRKPGTLSFKIWDRLFGGADRPPTFRRKLFDVLVAPVLEAPYFTGLIAIGGLLIFSPLNDSLWLLPALMGATLLNLYFVAGTLQTLHRPKTPSSFIDVGLTVSALGIIDYLIIFPVLGIYPTSWAATLVYFFLPPWSTLIHLANNLMHHAGWNGKWSAGLGESVLSFLPRRAKTRSPSRMSALEAQGFDDVEEAWMEKLIYSFYLSDQGQGRQLIEELMSAAPDSLQLNELTRSGKTLPPHQISKLTDLFEKTSGETRIWFQNAKFEWRAFAVFLRRCLTGETTSLVAGRFDSLFQHVDIPKNGDVVYQFIRATDLESALLEIRMARMRLQRNERLGERMALVVKSEALALTLRKRGLSAVFSLESAPTLSQLEAAAVREKFLQLEDLEHRVFRFMVPDGMNLPDHFLDRTIADERFRFYLILSDSLNPVAVEVSSHNINRMIEIGRQILLNA